MIGTERKDKRRGRMMIYCSECNMYFMTTAETFSYACPKCGSFVGTMRCTRCGHEWTPRHFGDIPRACPACRSPYWCRERVRGEDGKVRE